MKNRLLTVAGTIVLVAIIITCTHKPFTPISSPVNPHGTPPVDSTHTTDTFAVDTSVCFERDVLPIFIGSCAKPGCHDAITHAEDLDLSNYNLIVSNGIVPYVSSSSSLYTICVIGAMPTPPTPLLDSTQLSFIRRWIDKGAPNDTNCAVTCDTSKYTFVKAVVPILKTYCYGCHATSIAPTSGGGFVLDTYTGVQVQAQNGKLYGDLNHDAGFHNMPLGGKKLPDCMIAQVKKWIDAGAQNN